MIEIFLDYVTHDGELVVQFLPEELRYGHRLGSAGPGSFSHMTALSNPLLTRDIVAPKRNDYFLRLTENEGATFTDVQGGFLWNAGLKTDEYATRFGGITWDGWLEQSYPHDREITQQDLLDDADVLTEMYIGLPTSPHDWFDDGSGVNQRIIIEDLIASLDDGSPHAIALSPDFGGSHWVNVPTIVEGLPGGETFTIEPFDYSPIRGHINSLATLNDPWVPDFRCLPSKLLEFFFLKNKDPSGETIPDFAVFDDEQIIDIDWHNLGPSGTYVTGWGEGNFPKWFTTTHVPSEEKFRRWRTNHQLGPAYKTQEQIEQGTRAFADKYPQKDLTLIVKPEFLDPVDRTAGFRNVCGKIIDVDFDFPDYHRIDAIFYIISQDIYSDGVGNWQADLGLQQIYTS